MITQKSKLLTIINQIGKGSEKRGLDFTSINKQVTTISEFLNCSDIQGYVFSLIMYISLKEKKTKVKEISSHLEIDPIELLELYPEFRHLEKRKFIKRSGNIDDSISDYYFSVPNIIVESLVGGNKDGIKVRPVTDSLSLLVEIKKLLEDFKDNLYNTEEIYDEINGLLTNYINLEISKKVIQLRLDSFDFIVLFAMCVELMNGHEEVDLNNLLEEYVKHPEERFHIKRSIIHGYSELVLNKLVKIQDGMFVSDREVLLTEDGVDFLFGKESDLFLNSSHKRDNSTIHPDSLAERKMHYNISEESEIKFLQRTLRKTNYNKVLKKLEQYKLQKGITILLHGAPGVGKTETVYQLAKKTGRGIFHVDISETKSMWFGESEKRIKAIFDKYAKMVKNSTHPPILLFNEADGILSTRKQIGSSPVDQTENAIQNIILQELENIQGILIATTNLTSNLDAAFERRFLYKIKFNKPDKNVRARLWAENITELKKKDVIDLSINYPFTGGQIVNISKKYLMKKVLDHRPIKLSEIKALCEQETLEDKRLVKKIGFEQ